MSVLVKGWSIPTDGCCGCYFRTGKYCGILGKNERVLEYAERYTRPDNCPLVDVPIKNELVADFVDTAEKAAKVEIMSEKDAQFTLDAWRMHNHISEAKHE